MKFNSVDFLLFFSCVFALYYLLPQRFKWFLLLASGLVFYAYKKPAILLIYLVVPIILVYYIGIRIGMIPASPETRVRRKWWLIGGLTSSLALLILFRYADFIGGNISALFGTQFKPFEFIVPIGLSFYSFKMVSYLMDVYNEKIPAEKSFGHFALYVSFFPQVMSGPIERAGNFIPQIREKVHFDAERVVSGLQLVSWGLFKKIVISDRLAMYVNEIYASPAHQGLNLLLAAYFYSIQIYCDFSGYTDIAIGVARILGINSMKNFEYPYFSKSMTEFWNRWHISLSTWLRDYLFLPIAYAVMRPIKSATLWKIKAETWGYMVGMLITMLLAGLWHGPSWPFVIWGLLHGLYLVIGFVTKKSRKKFVKKIKLNKVPWLHNAISVFITFNLVSLAWIFFRSETLEKAFVFIKYIQLVPSSKGSAYVGFNLVMIAIFIAVEIIYKNKNKIKWVEQASPFYKMVGFAFFICLIIIFAVDATNEFIYFKF